MTSWQEAVFSLCLCGVLTGLVRLLLPSGNWQRIGQTVTAFLLVASILHIVSSFFGQTIHSSIPMNSLEPATVVSEKGLDLLEQATVEQTHHLALQLAQQTGVDASNIRIQTAREHNQVSVKTVTVTVSGEQEAVTTFQKALSHSVGGEVTVERREKK